MIRVAVCAALLAAASGSANSQQTNQSDSAFIQQRASGVPKPKPQIKARPKTSKCADGFDCSELTQWAASQTSSKKSRKGNPRLKPGVVTTVKP